MKSSAPSELVTEHSPADLAKSHHNILDASSEDNIDYPVQLESFF